MACARRSPPVRRAPPRRRPTGPSPARAARGSPPRPAGPKRRVQQHGALDQLGSPRRDLDGQSPAEAVPDRGRGLRHGLEHVRDVTVDGPGLVQPERPWPRRSSARTWKPPPGALPPSRRKRSPRAHTPCKQTSSGASGAPHSWTLRIRGAFPRARPRAAGGSRATRRRRRRRRARRSAPVRSRSGRRSRRRGTDPDQCSNAPRRRPRS